METIHARNTRQMHPPAYTRVCQSIRGAQHYLLGFETLCYEADPFQKVMYFGKERATQDNCTEEYTKEALRKDTRKIYAYTKDPGV